MNPSDLLDADDRAWVKAWLRYASGDWGLAKPPGNLPLRLKRMQQFRPRAFQWLILNHPKAAQLATPPQHSRSNAELAHSSALVAATIASLNHTEEPVAQAQPRAYHLSREQLNVAYGKISKA